MKRKVLWLFLAFLLAACQVAPVAAPSAGSSSAPAAAGSPKPGGWIKVANIEDPDSLDPHKTIMATASSIQAWIYDTLFYIGDDKLPHGLLAESWTVSEDGKTLTIKLRQGRKFHDGTPVDAKAVEFTFQRMLDPKTASPAKDQVGPLEKVTAKDDATVEFVFKEPYAPFFFAASTSYLGIISPTAVQKEGDNFSRQPVGSGPFMFKEWKAGADITLVRNPNYVGVRDDRKNKGAPYVEGIIFKNIPEEGTRIAALRPVRSTCSVYRANPCRVLKPTRITAFCAPKRRPASILWNLTGSARRLTTPSSGAPLALRSIKMRFCKVPMAVLPR